jgi:serine/threonine-protein kinase
MLGTKLRNRYLILKELGIGGFGHTFLAQDCDFPGQPWCVVKQLKPQSEETWVLQTARRLFDQEASVLARIGNHPQIPHLKAYFEEEEQFYLVQQYIEGSLLSEEFNGEKPWRQEDAIAFLEDILGILGFIHENQVIHRDLKPDNIIRRQSDQKLVLIDFGSVKKITVLNPETGEDSELTVAVGTPTYMPLEQQGGKPSYSSDIYALGKIVIQGLTGISPKKLSEDSETGELLWQHLVKIDHDFVDILSRMVKLCKRDRYQTATEVLEDLRPYLWNSPSAFQEIVPHKLRQTSNTIDQIVRHFKQHPEISRIKKLLFCACKHRWENSSQVLMKHRTKSLLQELYQREPNLNSFQTSINGVVSTLNKKDKYQLVADLIINQVKYLYESSQRLAIDQYENYDADSSQLTDLSVAEHTQPSSSGIYVKLQDRN